MHPQGSHKKQRMSVCLSVCLSVWLAGWLAGCMHACMYVRMLPTMHVYNNYMDTTITCKTDNTFTKKVNLESRI